MLTNEEKFNIFFLHNENKVNNKGLFYKKITDFCGVFDEINKISVGIETSKNSEHFHLFLNNQIVGMLLLSHVDKAYKIEDIYLENENYFIPFVFTLYWNISMKINPISFTLASDKYLSQAMKMHFENKKGSYVLDMNPRNLDAFLKREKII